MDPKDVPTNTEAELESFRQKWREEVTARAKGKTPASSASAKPTTTSSSTGKPHPNKSNASDAQHHTRTRSLSLEGGDEVNSYTYHNLGEKQHGQRLDETSAQTAASLLPSSGAGFGHGKDHSDRRSSRRARGADEHDRQLSPW